MYKWGRVEVSKENLTLSLATHLPVCGPWPVQSHVHIIVILVGDFIRHSASDRTLLSKFKTFKTFLLKDDSARFSN